MTQLQSGKMQPQNSLQFHLGSLWKLSLHTYAKYPHCLLISGKVCSFSTVCNTRRTRTCPDSCPIAFSLDCFLALKGSRLGFALRFRIDPTGKCFEQMYVFLVILLICSKLVCNKVDPALGNNQVSFWLWKRHVSHTSLWPPRI